MEDSAKPDLLRWRSPQGQRRQAVSINFLCASTAGLVEADRNNRNLCNGLWIIADFRLSHGGRRRRGVFHHPRLAGADPGPGR
jgi:hypothetical protein